MERKTIGLLGILVAVSALLHPIENKPSGSAPSPAESKTPEAALALFTCDTSERRGPWEAARRVFVGPPTTGVGDEWGAIPPGTTLKFLTVTVADPDRTHLALNFDRVVESVIWSLEDAGYIFHACRRALLHMSGVTIAPAGTYLEYQRPIS